MPRPTYTPPPNPAPSLGDPDFSANASGYLGWFPTFGSYVENMANWYETGFAKELINGTVAAPAMAFASDPDTGIYRAGANKLGFSVGGVARASLSATALEVNVPITGTAVQSSVTDATPGRLMKAGAFGWGGQTVPPSLSGSINELDKPNGVYRYDQNTPGDLPLVGTDGTYMHLQRDGGLRAHQVAWPQNRTESYTRAFNGTEWSPWRLNYNQTNILGNVSQSGGVPTGSVIERGSNANGEYVRFADGTQICAVTATAIVDVTRASGGGFRSGSGAAITFPATFAVAPRASGGTTNNAVWNTYGAITTTNAIVFGNSLSSQTGVSANLLAFGRWF